jgi:hypothetical protein
MATEIHENRIYILTDDEGQETMHVSLRKAEHGWRLTGGISVLDDGRVVEGSVGADGRYYVDAEYGTIANLTDVGAREDDAAYSAAIERSMCTRQPDRDPHFGCDHQDAPCQVRGSQHRTCPSYWRYLCSQCKEV